MTNKQSEFGSLTDRTTHAQAPPPHRPLGYRGPASVRHAWLDKEVPVLLTHWRLTEHRTWEDHVIGAAPHGPATAWIAANRLTPAIPTPNQDQI